MKRRLLSVLLMMVLAIPISFGLSGISAFADDGDYIEIKTVDDFYNISNDPSANYILMNDLDFSEATAEGGLYDNNNKGWSPLTQFSGVLDGNGHTISGIREQYSGISGGTSWGGIIVTNTGEIRNLHYSCDNMRFSTSCSGGGTKRINVGGIVGVNNGTIKRCSVTGTIGGMLSTWTGGYIYTYIGGIAGEGTGRIEECYSSITYDYELNRSSDGGNIYLYRCGISYSNNIENCYYNNCNGISDTNNIVLKGKAVNCYCLDALNNNGVYYDNSGSKKTLNQTQMLSKASYTSLDFDNIWIMETATDYKYPQLRNNMQDSNKHVDIIEWKTQPSKIDFYTDEDIDPTGGVFTAYYIDDTHEDIEVTKDMLSGYDMTQLGVQTVTVTFREGTLTYDILTSTRPEVKSLTLETMPDKTEFARGTAFDFTGATAKVEYVNGKTDIIPIPTEECTGGNINQSGTYTITFEKFGKTVTFDVKVVPVKPIGIKIVSLPNKTTYIEGQSLDLTGLVVKLEYNSGKTETITDYTVGEYENTVGTSEITLTYENFTASFSVEFVEKKLTNIMVTTQPSKAKYVVGEAFDPTGMVVKAVYDNGISEEITDYTVSDLPEATGWQTLTVSYEGKTTTIRVMVEAKELVSIFVSQMPNKTTYIEGETFDPEGMVVMANYNDVLNEEITDYTLSGTTLNKVGESKITILYEGMTASFNVTVVEKKLVKITVTPPTKTEYIAGEAFDDTGMVVKAVYDNGKSETVTGYTVNGFGDTAEDNAVTIEYGGKTAAFIVTIHTPEAEWTVTQTPTCTAGGSRELHCADCGKLLKTEELDALGHDWSEWATVDAPNCTDKGSQKRVCGRCSKEEFKDVDPNGHSWDEEYTTDVAPTCTSEGSESWHCSECGVSDPTHTRAIEKLPHNLGEWTTTKEPTCAVAGVKQRVCADCDYLETEEIPATGNHTYGDWTTTKEPTCTEKGSKDRECSVCHHVETAEIAALDHDWSKTPTVDKAPTCTENGKESTHCTRCNAVKEGSEKTIPAAGHKFSAWKTTKKATELAPGQQSRTCSVCGKTETKAIAQLKPSLPAVKISTPKAAKKAATIKWKKVSAKNQKKIAKIEIQYSTDKNFKKGVKTVYAKKSATSKKIKKLKSKKTYYVRIRAYKKDSKGVHISKWSTVKKVKAK